MLFSPLALPDIEVAAAKNGKGASSFVSRSRGWRSSIASGAPPSTKRRLRLRAAWYLDEDYDGDCFVDCQMFFDFKKTPNIKAALKAEVDPDEFTLKLDFGAVPGRSTSASRSRLWTCSATNLTIVRDLT